MNKDEPIYIDVISTPLLQDWAFWAVVISFLTLIYQIKQLTKNSEANRLNHLHAEKLQNKQILSKKLEILFELTHTTSNWLATFLNFKPNTNVFELTPEPLDIYKAEMQARIYFSEISPHYAEFSQIAYELTQLYERSLLNTMGSKKQPPTIENKTDEDIFFMRIYDYLEQYEPERFSLMLDKFNKKRTEIITLLRTISEEYEVKLIPIVTKNK